MKNNIFLIKIILIFFTILKTSYISFAQTSALDVAFANNGIAITPIGINNAGNAVVIQNDGKLVVAGYADNGLSSGYDFTVTRYNINGSLDSTFDFDGIVTTDIGSSNDYALSVAIQTNGKIVVAGYSENMASSFANDIAIVRYNINGSLDTSFGSSGKMVTSISIYNDYGFSVAIQTDDRIIVAGYIDVPTVSDILLVRYNINGTLDTTFDADGIVTTSFGALGDVAYSMVLQQDGKIVVTGFSNNGANQVVALARYNTNGSLDTSFDIDGKVTTSIGNNNTTGTSLTIQNDGRLVVVGFIDNGLKKDILLTRYNIDGSLDTTFDADGIATTTIGTENDIANSVDIQQDGKIIIGGYTTSSTNSDFCTIRYTINGALDSSLDLDGIITTPVGSLGDYGASVNIQNDGKIVLAGTSYNGTSPKQSIVRYNISSPSEINSYVDTQANIHFYPNPFMASTTLNSDLLLVNAKLNIYNNIGLLVKTITNINGREVVINRDDLPNGLYYIQMKQGSEIISKNKLIIMN